MEETFDFFLIALLGGMDKNSIYKMFNSITLVLTDFFICFHMSRSYLFDII